MKNLRMFLSALLVFSVVGTTLAFKANYGNGEFACTDSPAVCPTTKDFNESPIGSEKYCGRPETDDCTFESSKKLVINVGQ
jgi:hypothetical protein